MAGVPTVRHGRRSALAFIAGRGLSFSGNASRVLQKVASLTLLVRQTMVWSLIFGAAAGLAIIRGGRAGTTKGPISSGSETSTASLGAEGGHDGADAIEIWLTSGAAIAFGRGPIAFIWAGERAICRISRLDQPA